jgi:hypothetical protein
MHITTFTCCWTYWGFPLWHYESPNTDLHQFQFQSSYSLQRSVCYLHLWNQLQSEGNGIIKPACSLQTPNKNILACMEGSVLLVHYYYILRQSPLAVLTKSEWWKSYRPFNHHVNTNFIKIFSSQQNFFYTMQYVQWKLSTLQSEYAVRNNMQAPKHLKINHTL